MSKNDKELIKSNNTVIGIKESMGKPYSKQRLELLGDLRYLTLGGSPGSGDSGSSTTRSPFGGHHGLVINSQGLPLPGTNPLEFPTPDNPFLP